MKLRKVLMILGISVSLVGTQVFVVPADAAVPLESYTQADTEKIIAIVDAILWANGQEAEINLDALNLGALNLENINLEELDPGNINLQELGLANVSLEELGFTFQDPVTEGDGADSSWTEGDGTDSSWTEGDGTDSSWTEGGGTGTEGTGTEGSETGTEGTETEGSETGTEGTETEGSETGTEGTETEGSETDTEGTETEGSETGTEGTETEGSETESEKTEGESPVAPKPVAPVSPVVPGSHGAPSSSVRPTLPESSNTDTELDLGTYEASSKFLDDREKIKYSVDIPLEGIPSFITQEMIVGALKCQDEKGYPASVTIAQIIQESGYGLYGPGGEDGKGLSYLAYQYNNLFGIKGTGTAGSVSMNTGEQTPNGISYMTRAGFRVYNTYTECIQDRAELLDDVYSDLTFGVEDANTFAMKIGRRWATAVNYGQSLIKTMERYDLYRLDEMTLDEFSDMLAIFVNPCPGATLTSNFGLREEPIAGAGNYHKGIDLGTGEYNIPTYAAAKGKVIFAGDAGTAGNMVIIDHGKGLVTKYMHHDKLYVKTGEQVEKGQQIGLSGATGQAVGNHLHFQVEKDGKAVDPMTYLGQKGSSKKIQMSMKRKAMLRNSMRLIIRKAARKYMIK